MKKILVTGCSGLVGIHLVKLCIEKGYDVIGVDIKSSKYLPKSSNFRFYKMDLTDINNIKNLFSFLKPDAVFNTFGVKGSPMRAKNSPVDFLYPSFLINTEIINQCAINNVWLVFVSSVGVYSPSEKFVEDSVWKTLPSEADWFPSWSKRMGEILLDAYSVQYDYHNYSIIRPANIFGEYDDFTGNGTVIASTVKKVFEAEKSIQAWGDGSPIRDFVYAKDVAFAIFRLYEEKIHDTINFGSGEEVSIKNIIEMIIKVSKKNIQIEWDKTKPNGDLRRLMDIKKQIKYGILPSIPLITAIKNVYDFYSNNLNG